MNRSAAKTVVDFSFFYSDLMFTVYRIASVHPISSLKELSSLFALPKQGRIRYNICHKDKTDRCKCRCLMNMAMPASIIRMPFLLFLFIS